MQQISSYVRWATVTGLATALIGLSACVVTSTDDTGGAAGDAGEAPTAGTSSVAGSGGSTAGSGGASAGAGGSVAGTGGVPYKCDEDTTTPGTPNPTCAPPAGSENDCTKCVETNCCTEYKECYATDPGNQCGWGGPNDEGEIVCMQLCAQKALADQGVLGEDEINACNAQCTTTKAHGATQDCDLPGGSTSTAFSCIKDKCMVECIGAP